MMRSTRGSVSGDRGFTLIKMVIAVAIGVVILATFTVVFSQSLGTSRLNNSRVTAIRNLDVAGAWFIRDFQAAQSVPASADYFVLGCPGGITVVQSVDSTSDSSVEYAITIGGDLLRKAGVATAMIAQYIASVEYIQGDAISASTANITAVVGSIAISKTYNVEYLEFQM